MHNKERGRAPVAGFSLAEAWNGRAVSSAEHIAYENQVPAPIQKFVSGTLAYSIIYVSFAHIDISAGKREEVHVRLSMCKLYNRSIFVTTC
jgi:hypothetical protein